MLTVPKDRVVTLDVVSADVAHSWWVPAFGGKIDAIPGKTNHTWFQAQKAGDYPIRCAEFCGIQHAAMHGVRARRPGDARVRGSPASDRARQAGVQRRLRELPRPRRRGADRPGDRDEPDAAGSEGAAAARARTAAARCRAVGATWDDRVVNALSALPQVALRRQAEWRLTPRPSR